MNVRFPLRVSSPGGTGIPRSWAVAGVVIGTSIAVAATIILVDTEALSLAWSNLTSRPLAVVGAIAAFGLAFLIRSVVWARMLPGLSLSHAWAAIHVALAGNHVLPLRLGEPLRVLSVARRTRIGAPAAAASTLTLRSADTLAVVGIAVAIGGVGLLGGATTTLVVALVFGAGLVGLIWSRRLRRLAVQVRFPGPVILAGTTIAWFAEAGLVWIAADATGIEISFLQAVFVTAVSVAAQLAAFAPGGFGTYEAGAVAAYAYLGHDPAIALAAGLTAHALKTAYSLLAGAAALYVPEPPLPGRIRLPKQLPPRPGSHPVTDDQPVVVFMPAHDEEDSVGDVVRRVPEEIGPHPVVTLVIDDGSGDRTAEEAAEAGAAVIRQAPNRGLGAAVRRGFQEATRLDPAAVVFLDADGEYAPEELHRMVRPILEGRADYVVGSRFAGDIQRMLPHRRLGNLVLTRLLSWVARRKIGDGQSGYRALSRRAAEEADIIHDYNYAQVLTLDLLGKGFIYEEVPISYRFRTTGRSFIRLGRYLSNVIPAVYRELNPTTS